MSVDKNDLDSSSAKRRRKIKSLTRDKRPYIEHQLLSLPMKTTTESCVGTGEFRDMIVAAS
nr:ASN_HP1_G0050700.mRNA.1.CDS.1 [Saccharomyces cerevisiae]